MAVNITSPPFTLTVLPEDWYFTFIPATSSLCTEPQTGGSIIYSGNQTAVIGDTEQECYQYIEDNNITDPYDLTDEVIPYNIAGSNGYGNTADPLNFNRN